MFKAKRLVFLNAKMMEQLVRQAGTPHPSKEAMY
jgi:hypothetical protein